MESLSKARSATPSNPFIVGWSSWLSPQKSRRIKQGILLQPTEKTLTEPLKDNTQEYYNPCVLTITRIPHMYHQADAIQTNYPLNVSFRSLFVSMMAQFCRFCYFVGISISLLKGTISRLTDWRTLSLPQYLFLNLAHPVTRGIEYNGSRCILGWDG